MGLLDNVPSTGSWVPETQEADIQMEEDVTKVQKFLADIMKELRIMRKCAPSRISFVKISLGLMVPGMW